MRPSEDVGQGVGRVRGKTGGARASPGKPEFVTNP
jgi:hypothetical protein